VIQKEGMLVFGLLERPRTLLTSSGKLALDHNEVFLWFNCWIVIELLGHDHEIKSRDSPFYWKEHISRREIVRLEPLDRFDNHPSCSDPNLDILCSADELELWVQISQLHDDVGDNQAWRKSPG
jgi:hypothetical protein